MNIFLKFCYQQKLKLWSFICSGLQSLEPGIKWDVIKRILLNHFFHSSIWHQHTVRRNEKIVSSWAFWAYLKSRRNSQEFLEFATEFPSKSAVYKKVDRRVEGYQKVRNLKEKFGTTTLQFNISSMGQILIWGFCTCSENHSTPSIDQWCRKVKNIGGASSIRCE